jgi:hypothetical protein
MLCLLSAGVIHALSEVMLYSTLQDLGIPTPDPTATPIETTPPPAPVDQCQTLGKKLLGSPIPAWLNRMYTHGVISFIPFSDEIICGEEQL